ncbi:MAG: transcriptional regulator [Candidatus Hydrothermarchaeales archaeon]
MRDQMDERAETLMHVSDTLDRSSFEVSDMCEAGASSFDIFARKGILLLLLKVLANIDSFSQGQAIDLTNIARFLSGYPLLIGRRTRNSYMADGVVYERHGVYAINYETLEEILIREILPMVLAARGGYYVKIDSDHLKETRREYSISLGELAANIGVSRRMVAKYENEGAMATFETAVRLEEFLDKSITVPLDIFSVPETVFSNVEIKSEFVRIILSRLSEIGFRVCPVRTAPFDALTEEDKNLMLTKVRRSNQGIGRDAKILKSISETVLTDAFFVVKHLKEKSLGGIPVIIKKELDEIEEPSALVEALARRRG